MLKIPQLPQALSVSGKQNKLYMKENKHIERDGEASKIFDNRSLKVDYRTLEPILKEGMTVFDVGCGTGSISKDIANIVGDSGKVIMRLNEGDQYSYNRYMEYLSYKASEVFTLKLEAEDKVRQDEKTAIAENAIIKGMNHQLIADITGLSLEQIEEIRINLAKK